MPYKFIRFSFFIILLLNINNSIFGQENADADCNCQTTVGTGGQFASLFQYLTATNQTLPLQFGCLRVVGSFKINVSPTGTANTFNGMTIEMAPGADIEVSSNVTFNLQSTTFRGCTELWQGINLLSDAKITAKNCTFSDAKIAVKVESVNLLGVSFDNSKFINNFIGFAAINTVSPIEFSGVNKFEYTSLLPGTLPASPAGGAYSGSAGLMYINSPVVVGLNGGISAAEFSGMDYGVIFKASGTKKPIVTSCNFNNHKIAIVCDHTSGEHTILFNIISKVQKGYYEFIPGGYIFFQNNTISASDKGFESISRHLFLDDFAASHGMKISDNTINTGVSDCIKILDANGPGNITVGANILYPGETISLSHSTAWGINISPLSLFAGQFNSGFLIVFGNNIRYTGPINTYGAQGGIYVNNANLIPDNGFFSNTILRNQIRSNHKKRDTYGIHVSNSPGLTIKENRMEGWTNIPKFISIPQGIRLENSTNSKLECNFMNYTNRGICIAMDNTTTTVRTSNFNTHSYALYYEQNAQTGDQDWQGNDWNNSSVGVDGYYSGSGTFAGLSFYNISTSNIGSALDFQVSMGVPNDWRFIGTDTESDCQTPSGNLGGIGELDRYFAAVPLNATISALDWEGKRHLWDKLTMHPEYLNDTDAALFYASTPNTVLAGFTAMDNVIRNINNEASSSLTSLLNIQQDIHTLSNSISQIDNSIDAALAQSVNTAVLVAQFKGIQIDLTAKYAQLAAIESTLYNERQTRITNAMVQNQALAIVTSFQALEKSVNSLYLSSLLNGFTGFTESEQELINSYAALCPYLGGRGVYRARSLQSLYLPTQDYSETDECVGGINDFIDILEDRSSDLSGNKPDFIVAPNPANESINIRFSSPLLDDAQLVVMNSSGHKIVSTTLPRGEMAHVYNTSNLPQGTYYLQVFSATRATQITKIVIVH